MRFFPRLSVPYRACCFTVALTGLALPTIAAEFSFSNFGTVGYTISDQANHYQRFISCA